MKKENKTLLIVVSAPSGSGKTTIVNSVMEKMPNIKRSISCTTREPRTGEQKNVDYIFLTKEEFLKKIGKNEFLEWEENFGEYYGTPKEQMEEAEKNNNDLILSIDIKGARRVKEKQPESISIFIMPPSVEELNVRLKKRNTDDERQLVLRLREAKKEIEASDEYDYLVINDDLDKAIEEICSIISQEKENRKEQGKGEKNGKSNIVR